MISEDLLERGLTAAADSYDVPPAAIDDVRAQLEPVHEQRRHRPRLTGRAWLLSAAAALVGLVIAAIALGGGAHSGNRIDSLNGASSAGGAAISGPSGGTISGTGGSSGSSAGGGAPPLAAAPGANAGQRNAASGVHAPAAPSTVPAPQAGGGDDAKVVKTGEMDLQVDKGKVGFTVNRLTNLATFERGYIAQSHTDDGTDPSGSVTLRVPVQAFESTITQVRSLASVKVTSQQTSGEDVTSKYVDLQARLHALQATRTTFERLLARANTVDEILSVESRITDVQTQIEQLQGQIRVLNDQADLGTLTVTVDQKTSPVAATHHQSGMSKALHRSVDRFVNGIEAIVGILGPLLLVVLVVALGLVVGRVGYRRLRRELV
jgi:hypothetical protein